MLYMEVSVPYKDRGWGTVIKYVIPIMTGGAVNMYVPYKDRGCSWYMYVPYQPHEEVTGRGCSLHI